jgi:hypothetical protein
MIHSCNIHCHSIDLDKVEMMGIEDKGQWMPFAFHLDVVVAIKLTSQEEDSFVYNCTTVFTEHGDNYIIDTPYVEFLPIFTEHYNSFSSPTEEEEDDNDLDF